MTFQHKLRKLLGLDWLRSGWDHARRWSRRIDTKPLLAALDPAGLARLRERYVGPGRTVDVGDPAKFADADYWLKQNVERALDLSLDRRTPLRVLDLGCGAGWFLYVCRHLGHEAVGMDLDENPFYRDAIDLLGVQRIVGRIEPFVALPSLGGKFALASAHCICFQKLPSPKGVWREWGVEEWRFFLDDMRTNVLLPGGELLLDFNPRGGGAYYPREVKELFRQEGARIFRSRASFKFS